jgi:segregation and condensation protein A
MSGIITQMELGIATHQTRAYSVAIPVYEGPLDLLLQLIEHAELDITKVALALVTDQYLEHIRSIEENSPEEVSAFLVIAARLLQIKSEALLPRPPVREEGEEDPGEALARQLRAYKRYKEIALLLGDRETRGLRTFLRLGPPPKVEVVLDMSGIGLADLWSAAREILNRRDDRPGLDTVVKAPRITIRDKIRIISQRLREKGRETFRSMVGNQPTRLDVVVTFLAMLELVKRHFVSATQDQLFGDIEIVSSDNWDEDISFELEFGE